MISETRESTPTPIDEDVVLEDVRDAYDDMRSSMSSVREVIKNLQTKVDAGELDMQDGISLLAVKSHLMLSYLQSLVLLSARRALGDSLMERKQPSASFSKTDRGERGDGAGDRVDSMIEGRVVLEKIKVLEGRMKYQIDKLVRVAGENEDKAGDVANGKPHYLILASNKACSNVFLDPLAFKPNPEALLNQEIASGEEDNEESGKEGDSGRAGIYRPPKLAPMPYTEPMKAKDKDKTRRAPVPGALASLAHLDPSMPHVESASGLGSTPALMSKRARELKRMTEFEEENFTRLMMKKKDMKRRKQDEADLALGGNGTTGLNGRGGGLEDEFGDVLRSVGRSRGGIVGDGYEELRQKGKKGSVLERSRVHVREDGVEEDEGRKERKRSRFEKEVKASKKRVSVRSRR
ncbi:hypothetical protein BDY19DRAFT_920726 [Irpex rosettiformis]|uniref:Uncharacterized protein n=1 Tax=Irpex rosettiformis TaxID=378272 RepID=A0ACB8UIF0_9APHY|nr:hypothetical protein BDY19DRAFT_920726 [Irpex rosettiformis]